MTETRERKSNWGCLLKPILFSIVCLVAGTWMLANWNTLPGAGKAGAIVLVVLGTVVALPLVIYILIRLFIKRVMGQLKQDMGEMTGGFAKMANFNKKMFAVEHVFRAAVEADWEVADRPWYDEQQRLLEERGFTFLGDEIDQTVKEVGSFCPPMRVMLGPGGTTMIAFYDVSQLPGIHKLAGMDTETVRTVDVLTEFSDGSMLLTANTEGMDLSTPPPGLERRLFPNATPIADLLEKHEAEKALLLGNNPNLHAMSISTLEETRALTNRLNLKKAADRQGKGYIDGEQVSRMAKKAGCSEDEATMMGNAAEASRDESDEPKE